MRREIERVAVVRAHDASRFAFLQRTKLRPAGRQQKRDGDGERALMMTVNYHKKAGITTVIIAHRPSILATVDKILVLKQGGVEAFGPREEILARYRPTRALGTGE